MKTRCKLARVFKVQRHKRVTTCNRVTSAQNWKYQLTPRSEVKCKSSYYVYRCATKTKLCQCASTLYIHWKSQQTVHEVARVGYFCLSSNPLWTTARFSVTSDTGVKCVAGVSFVTSLVPTTTCPTTPTHYIYQVTVRTSHVARCM